MPSQHPQGIGYGHVVESYVTRMYAGLPRYLVLNGGRGSLCAATIASALEL
ncbi:hypothetical protein [Streptomyces sp. NPDC053367]|uniref:hypothetical protein n=1 Tax=Streptomyces sp. NPDC053367 TaxID=3365700 RepID=UPI0037D0703D